MRVYLKRRVERREAKKKLSTPEESGGGGGAPLPRLFLASPMWRKRAHKTHETTSTWTLVFRRWPDLRAATATPDLFHHQFKAINNTMKPSNIYWVKKKKQKKNNTVNERARDLREFAFLPCLSFFLSLVFRVCVCVCVWRWNGGSGFMSGDCASCCCCRLLYRQRSFFLALFFACFFLLFFLRFRI